MSFTYVRANSLYQIFQPVNISKKDKISDRFIPTNLSEIYLFLLLLKYNEFKLQILYTIEV
jgi:hypothetical protein